jgi:Zn ribbon nucleic-acid-binding protein
MNNQNQIVGNCPICNEHSLHFNGNGETEVQQCINCGMASTTQFKLEEGQSKDDNEPYSKLTEEMQKWSVVENNRIWIPSMITLPFGMLYPFNNDNGEMKWAFAEMVDIPEEEQKNYPIQGQEGKFYKRQYDTANSKAFSTFLEGIEAVNKQAKDVVDNAKK